MIEAAPGLDVSKLVTEVLSGPTYISSRFSQRIRSILRIDGIRDPESPRERLFNTGVGRQAAAWIGNEYKALDLLSTWSIEILFEYISTNWRFDIQADAFGKRFLAVPGASEAPRHC
jgi:hypothetical protein